MMSGPRLPYRDDTFDGEELGDAPASAIDAARARVDEAEEARRPAIYWNRRATFANREIRARHLQTCTRTALAASAELRRLEAGQ